MNEQPTNLYYTDDIDERKLADICYTHGYITARYIQPLCIQSEFEGRAYYLIPEAGTKIAGFITIGGEKTTAVTWFDGTIDEFLASLTTFEERWTHWYGEQLKWIPAGDTPAVNVATGKKSGAWNE